MVFKKKPEGQEDLKDCPRCMELRKPSQHPQDARFCKICGHAFQMGEPYIERPQEVQPQIQEEFWACETCGIVRKGVK